MQRIFLLMAAAAVVTACSNEAPTPQGEARRVVFNLSADEYGSPTFTRATSIEESDMTDLWVFDFVNEECVQYIHLTPDDDEWGTPAMTMAQGTHNVCFLASRGDNPALDEDAQTVTWITPRDAFWCDKDVEITQGTSSVAASLNRIATKLRIVVNDEVPASAKSITATPARWYFGVNYWTGEPAAQQTKARAVNIPASYAGTSGQLAISFFGISGKNEWTTDVTLSSTDVDDNTMASVTISGAPFKANRSTEYSGRLFGEDAGMSITLNDTWNDPYSATW